MWKVTSFHKYIIPPAESLKHECGQQTKLRTFNTFKQFGSLPSYVTKPLSFHQRKHLAKIRLGVLALRIETGRYSRPRLEIHERICPLCSENRIQRGLLPQIETGAHFLFSCVQHITLRVK